MATVKEVKLMKDGEMVTPLTLIDSVKNLDGTKFKDSVYMKSETYTKNEVNANIDSILPNKFFTCKRSYSSSQELDLEDICTVNVGELVFYSLKTSSGGIKLSINNSIGVRYFALAFANGALTNVICGGWEKTTSGVTTGELIGDTTSVNQIIVIAVRTE